MARLRDGATGDSHNGRPQNGQRTVNPPTECGSTILFSDCATFLDRTTSYHYGRSGTPTHRAFEENLARLEGADGVFLAPSGLAAVTLAMLAMVKSGDHILVTDSAYDPTRAFCDGMLRDMGVETTYYDPQIGAGIASLIRPTTSLIWCESPGSLTFEIQDLPAIVAAAKDIPVLIDNTWGAGVVYKPLALGAAISVQALTKYVGGHSDLLMGAVFTRGTTVTARVAKSARLLGHSVSGQDVALAHRGLRTLHRRLAVHDANGRALAEWLSRQPLVDRVYHPALSSHPQHALWQRDFSGSCGLFGAVMSWDDRSTTERFINALQLFGLGYSWGGYESLCIPATPHRTAIPWTEKRQLLRFHVGLEEINDLKADIDQAFTVIA